MQVYEFSVWVKFLVICFDKFCDNIQIMVFLVRFLNWNGVVGIFYIQIILCVVIVFFFILMGNIVFLKQRYCCIGFVYDEK